MECPQGTHTHTGADGQTQLKCHDISVKHTNPNAQMYHQMAIQQATTPPLISDGMRARNSNAQQSKESWEKLGRALKQLYTKLNGRNKNRLIPLGAIMFATENMYRFFQTQDANMKNETQRKGYEKAFKSLYQELPDESKYSKFTPEEFDEVLSQVGKRMEQLLNDPKSHRKGTEQYGELLCYWQYLCAMEKSVMRSYNKSSMSSEDIESDETYDKIQRAKRLAQRRAQGKTQSLRDAISNRATSFNE